jgi:hypothetical protein
MDDMIFASDTPRIVFWREPPTQSRLIACLSSEYSESTEWSSFRWNATLFPDVDDGACLKHEISDAFFRPSLGAAQMMMKRRGHSGRKKLFHIIPGFNPARSRRRTIPAQGLHTNIKDPNTMIWPCGK